MSMREVTRLETIQRVIGKQIKVKEGAVLLGLSERQLKRLTRVYRHEGASGLVSKQRGKPSNNQVSEPLRAGVMGLVSSKYEGFGPTLACEKLLEKEGLKVSKETLRQWMKAEGLWQSKRRRQPKVHQLRARRSCLGELVQIDGSPHDWFEGRRGECCLLVFIDDATSRIQHLRFEEKETTFGYFEAMRGYIKEHGLPLALYSDKHSIFRVNQPESKSDELTQFGRAVKDLDIESICANTPQAKGRVERANGILQDRLVKELRLLGISDIETANAYLPTYIADYNRRFAVESKSDVDAHRRNIPSDEVLDLIFSLQARRKLTKHLELSYNNDIFQIKLDRPGYTMRQADVTVCESRDGTIRLIYKWQLLDYVQYKKNQKPTVIVDSKQINDVVDELVHEATRKAVSQKPRATHPWRQYERVMATVAARAAKRAAVTHNATKAPV